MQRWRRVESPADWLIVWIDLRTPKMGYRVSPVGGSTDPTAEYPQTAKAQTTVDFLRQQCDPPIDLAVNTVAFTPFPVTNGMQVFLCDPVWQDDDNRWDPAPGKLMLGLFPGRAAIAEAQDIRKDRPQIAFASFLWEQSVLVRHGKVVREAGGDAHARTAAGVSSDGRVLILLVADAYNPGVSEGLTSHDTAVLLHAAGAHDAILFDGGGSSTLVGRDAQGNAIVVNRPAGMQRIPGTLRYVAVNLGFTGLKQGNEPLPALSDWKAPWHVRTWCEVVLQFRVHPVRSGLITLLAVGPLWLMLSFCWRKYRSRHKKPLPLA